MKKYVLLFLALVFSVVLMYNLQIIKLPAPKPLPQNVNIYANAIYLANYEGKDGLYVTSGGQGSFISYDAQFFSNVTNPSITKTLGIPKDLAEAFFDVRAMRVHADGSLVISVVVYEKDSGPIGRVNRVYTYQDAQGFSLVFSRILMANPAPFGKGAVYEIDFNDTYLAFRTAECEACGGGVAPTVYLYNYRDQKSYAVIDNANVMGFDTDPSYFLYKKVHEVRVKCGPNDEMGCDLNREKTELQTFGDPVKVDLRTVRFSSLGDK